MHRYHAGNGTFAAKAALTARRLAFTEPLVVAKPAEAILAKVSKRRFDLFVMGSHGRGALQGLLGEWLHGQLLRWWHATGTVGRLLGSTANGRLTLR